MRRLLLAAALVAIAANAYAQPCKVNQGCTGCNGPTKIGQLSTKCPGTGVGRHVIVTDGTNSTDCTVGTGTTGDVHMCCYDGSAWTVAACGGGGGGGSAIVLNLGNNGSTESTGISQINTNADTNSIVTEASDVVLIDMDKDWPQCDLADDLACTGCVSDTDASDTLTVGSGGTVTWAALTGYPTGCAAGTFATSLTDTSLTCLAPSASNADVLSVGDCTSGACFDGTQGNNITFEGTSVDGIETILTAADPTSSDKTLTLPAETGTLCSTASTPAGCGDINGASSTTDNAMLSWNGTAGQAARNTQCSLTDTDADASTLGDQMDCVGGITSGDRNSFATPLSNKLALADNSATLGTSPSCANDGAAGYLTLLDDTNGAGVEWRLCEGTTDAGHLFGFQSIYFSSGGISVDGSNCTTPVEATINSGPKDWTIQCADSDSSVIYFKQLLPNAYEDGSAFYFVPEMVSTGTLATGITWNFQCQCRGDNDTIDTNWSADADGAVTLNLAATNGREEQNQTGAVTCNGSCVGADSMFIKANIVASSTNADVTTGRLLGVQMKFEVDALSDDN